MPRWYYQFHIIFFSVLALALWVVLARAQEHQHGVGDIPDWYSSDCCDRQDCRPVPDNEIEFGFSKGGQPAVFHKPTGTIFTRDRWRISQDERYHVCTRVVNPGTENQYFAQYCVYLRGGA